ncbi:MAG TPA: NAD-dependent malic enzyme, partial [Candidatus Paceibacterota bacterium]|nr:NAD-dependent malic enzyme [Candidatus Paceibacterota bacterium]
MDYYKASLKLHKKLRGKLEVRSKVSLRNKTDLSLAYTPGVAAVSRALGENPKLAKAYTIKSNSVAVISDGSSVLGLGNIGPYGALPVME